MSPTKPHFFSLSPLERKLMSDALEMLSFHVTESLEILHKRNPEAGQCERFREALKIATSLQSRLAG